MYYGRLSIMMNNMEYRENEFTDCLIEHFENMKEREILTEHEKEQARQVALEVVKTIFTLGFNHLIRWIGSLISKK